MQKGRICVSVSHATIITDQCYIHIIFLYVFCTQVINNGYGRSVFTVRVLVVCIVWERLYTDGVTGLCSLMERGHTVLELVIKEMNSLQMSRALRENAAKKKRERQEESAAKRRLQLEKEEQQRKAEEEQRQQERVSLKD